MASFQTHLNGGIAVSAAVSLSLYMSGLVAADQTIPIFALGVIGSLLPDIDSDSSKPVNALFSVLGAGMAFAMTLPLKDRFLPMELAGIWLGVYICVRYGVFEIFARFTVHRGVWHSWLGTAAAALATTNLAYWMWERPPEFAWIAGTVLGTGYLTHLLLDELSSVDLFNAKVKRSFGTALKPASLASPWSSVAMLCVVCVLLWLAPSPERLLGQVDVAWLRDTQVFGDHLANVLRQAMGHVTDWWTKVARLLSLG